MVPVSIPEDGEMGRGLATSRNGSGMRLNEHRTEILQLTTFHLMDGHTIQIPHFKSSLLIGT